MILSKNAFSQNPYLHEVNTQLRGIFSQITYPSSDVLFLYDRRAKLSDTTFYQNNSNDTLLSTMWLQLYDEFYYVAHDTLPLTSKKTIKTVPTNTTSVSIDIQGLQKGLYFVVLSTEHEQLTERLIIQ